MGHDGAITLVYTSIGFCLRLKFTRQGAQHTRKSFVRSLVVSKWFWKECHDALWEQSWLEVDSLQELECCLSDLNACEARLVQKISLYVVDGDHINHWHSEMFTCLRVERAPALKYVAIVLLNVTTIQQEWAQTCLMTARPGLHVEFHDEVRLITEPSQFPPA
ncbi:hypothetical protein HBH95_142790 [Parastagonospora nodorum]|nr:hypothetical protein HBH95_142790 [Parastagonospora nodorum]